MKETRAELIEKLSELSGRYAKLQAELETSKREAERFQRDYHREEGNAREAIAKLANGRQAILQVLTVKHGVALAGVTEFFRGKYHEEEGVTEDVRFLRFLHGVLDNQPPF